MNIFIFQKVVLFLSATTITLCVSYSCTHGTDKNIQDFYQKYSEQFNQDNHLNKRRILSDEEQKILADTPLSLIRVTTDMTGLDKGSLSAAQKTYLTSLVQTTGMFLSHFLKIVPTVGNNIFQNGNLTTCIIVNVTENDRTIGIPNSDLHLYIIYQNNISSNVLAGASWCSLNRSPNMIRPNFGMIEFNVGRLKAERTSYRQYQEDLGVQLHEIMHILGFGFPSFKFWRNPATNLPYSVDKSWYQIVDVEVIRGDDTIILKSENVLKTARKYYGCPTLSGMQLENQSANGFDGAHWERTIIANELMTASLIYGESSLSIFTVAQLKDTGFWGDVNENLTDSIYWGKEKGCNFPIQDCTSNNQYEEFQGSAYIGCTFGDEHKGYPNFGFGSENCYYQFPYPNTHCKNLENQSKYSHYFLDEYSSNSKCFLSTILYPGFQGNSPGPNRCHKYSCSSDHTVITITSLYLAGFSFVCNSTEAGHTKSAIHNSQVIGQITCPSNFQRFCDNQNHYNCKNSCSFNGICVRGRCMCNLGRTSDDCSMICSVYSENGVCVSACSSGKFANLDNVCRTTCPQGYYPAEGLCNLCDFSCSTCLGPAKNQCTACQFLTYLSENTCVQTCPTGNYADETSKSCLICPSGCADCTGPNCNSCVPTYKLQGNVCKQSCDSGFQADSSNVCQRMEFKIRFQDIQKQI